MKKAQVKMFESIAVLVVFMFLIVFGVSFYFTIQQSGLAKDQEKSFQLKSINIAQKVSHLPELDCVFIGVQQENCIDSIKLDKFKTILEGQQAKVDYFNLFGSSTVTLKKVYPNVEEIVLYDRPDESAGSVVTQIPLIIHDPINDFPQTGGFGYLEVRIYDTK